MADTVMWVFLIFSVMLAISLPLIIKYQKPSTSADIDQKLGQKDKNNLKSLWEINDIKQGVLVLPNNEYRMIVRLAAVDFFLLGDEEQHNVEDALASLLMGLSFQVQFLVTAEAIDARQAVQDVKSGLPALFKSVQPYAQEYARYLEQLTTERKIASRNAYLVVSFVTDMGIDYARAELLARVTSLADGLKTAKINCEVLGTPAIVDFMYHLLNRGKSFRPSEADPAGIMDSYHVSERQVRDIAG